MRLAPRTALALIASTSALLIAGRAGADAWPVSRHDPGRTGASAGTVPLTAPNVRWRAYVGGSPNDVNTRFGLGTPSTLVASVGGRFVAKSAVTQATLWQSEVLGSGSVVGMEDLSGDNQLEIIVQTAEQAHVLSGSTGAVLWSSPMPEMETMGAIRLVDLDGDGLRDIYVDNGVGAKLGIDLCAAYSLAGGTATKLWSLPMTITPQSINSGNDSLVDLNGDGSFEVVLPSWDTILLARGSDGSTIATLAPNALNGHPYPHANALGAQLDGFGDLELLVIQPHAGVGTQVTPGFAAYAVDVTTGQFTHMWSADTGSYESEIAANADVSSDLDGDGTQEVIFSFRSSAGGDAWTTRVLSGATGLVLDDLADARFEGAADLDGIPGEEIVVAGSTGLGVYSFNGSNLAQVGESMPGVRALMLSDPDLRDLGPQHKRLAVTDGPTGPMLITGTPLGEPGPQANVYSFTELHAFAFTGSTFFEVADYEPLVGSVTGVIRADYATRPYAQIAVGTTEGLVAVLDKDLAPTNGLVWIDGTAFGSFVGAGNIKPPPLVSADALGPFVAISGTAVGQVVANAQFASLIVPPIPRYWREELYSVSVVALNGASYLVGMEGNSLVARRTTNGVADYVVSMPFGWIWGAPVPLTVGGQSSGLVGVDWRVDGMKVGQLGVDLVNENIAWSSPAIVVGGFYGSSAGDIDGDGTDEWFSHSVNLIRRNAETGASSSTDAFVQLGYSLPMIGAFQTTSPELLLQSGGQGPKLVSSNMSVLWEATSSEAINTMAGAKTECLGATRFATAGWQSPYVRAYDGATGALVAERAYAGGQAFPSRQAAVDAGQRPGILSYLSSAEDVGELGPALLAGSSDGHLYVLDSCTLDVRWAANLGASLGEPVVADSDGDGENEILVSAANGFLYALDTSPCDAPSIEFPDLDNSGPTVLVAPGQNVTLSWAAVQGANSYEVALVSPDERPLWSPAYAPIDGTTATISLAGALAGRPYKVVVRGITPEGPGDEAFSKPIVVVDTVNPAASLSVTDGKEAQLDLTASDNVALDHYRLYVKTATSTRLVDDGVASSASLSRVLAWAPTEDLFGSDAVLSLEAFDSAELVGGAAVHVHITADGRVVHGSEAPFAPVEPGLTPSDVEEPAGAPARRPRDEARGCSTSGSGGAGTFALLAAVALAAGRRRRR